ncbi:hypothetical protein DID88_000182 [Monilinia fructigena]|uniref:Uncharacterized protein n=1 Tax=Monilinia fructigena TaxID=38457 RepID=A0A395IJC8_9HELO|nr:hypothetical protein DID88_000182 [Monilinia fructigena]
MGKEPLGIKGAVGRGKEKSVSSGKTRSVSKKAFAVDLISDDEDSPQKKRGDMEKNAGVERRLVKSLQGERIETQCMETTTREILGKKVELEFALKEENTRRIRAELAFNVEKQRRETVEHELEEANKSTEKV